MSDNQQPAQSTPSSPPDLFDLDKLRIGQNFEEQLGVKKHVTTVAVRKPTRQEWVRVRPGEENRLQTFVLEVKEERDTYLVDPALWPELQDVVASKVLVLCVTKIGVPFIWPIRLPGADGRLDAWNDSALTAVGIGEKSWVSVRANMSLGAYEVREAPGELGEPVWPELSFQELIKIAFRDKYLTDRDHRVLRRLRGEI